LDAFKIAAGMLGAAIQRQQVGETLRRQTEYLAALHETSLGLMNRLRLDELLEAIVNRAAHLLGTAHGFIALKTPDGETLELKVGFGMYQRLVGLRAARGEGLSGKVWQSLQPLTVDDYAVWEGRQVTADYWTRALVGIPLMTGPEFLGVLGIAHVEPERRFDEAQVELLKRLGQQASIALDNARLYDAAQQEIAARAQAEAALQKTNEQLADWLIEAENTSKRIALLNLLIGQMQACPTEVEACERFRRWGEKLFADELGAVYLLTPGAESAELAQAWGPDWPKQLARSECQALQTGQPYVTSAGSMETRCSHLRAWPHTDAFCMPMMAQGDVLGVLVLRSKAEHASLSKDMQSLAQTLAESLALTLVNIRLRDRLREQSIRDPLTGLFNRRYMEESLEREISRVARYRGSVGVVMLDIDYFKRFNDTYGHLAGDVLLKEVGNFLSHSLRSADIACRYGGEEFTLILPDAPLEVVRLRAEELRQGVRDLHVKWQGQDVGSITLSLGVAMYPAHGGSGGLVLRTADEALYRAKNQGRDQVVIANDV
jgi:diguanylate cyclase (GGDEF)-like protein